MYMIQSYVDRKWTNQGKVATPEKAIEHVRSFGVNQVDDFKICDCLRAIDMETQEVIISHPADFQER